MIVLMLWAQAVYAESDSSMNFSARFIGGIWTGNNNEASDRYESTEGSQFGMNIGYRNGQMYAGLNLQGGEYNFTGRAPDIETASISIPVSNERIRRSELDLVFGYYLTPRVSIFGDIKATTSVWQGSAYSQSYSGLGIGVAGNWPLNADWLVYGSLGLINNGKVSSDSVEIGSGKSAGLDVGALYSISNGHRLMLGLKSSTYVYEFDNGSRQTSVVGGAYIGYNYAFGMD